MATSVLSDPPAAAVPDPKAGDAKVDAAGKTEDPKPGEVKPKAEGSEEKPIEYTDFALPDGLSKEDATLTLFRDEASKLGLTQEQAQALVTKIGEQAALNGKAQTDNWIAMNNAWTAEIKADPEIGGAQFEPMRISTAKLFDDYIGALNTPEREAFNQALNLTGAGNNPAIVKAFARMAAAHTEGTHVSGNPAKTAPSFADQMYPTHNKQP